jgi:hypothetical protein
MSEQATTQKPNNLPPSAPSAPKSVLRSRTVWVQLVMLVASLWPAGQAWLVANPVEAAAVLAAVNVLVRFTTSGRIYLFSREGGDASGGMAGGLCSNVVVAGMVAGVSDLPPCSLCGNYLGAEAKCAGLCTAVDAPTLLESNTGGVTL